ncbi:MULTISPECIES: SDR family NAD(P)-dependent oxidoreductase [Pseudonocardia]|uniref:3-oxoacyl-[acyl-carrier-protein] reductase FabG n=2 Tax=Pseudonocardia TaxID=1847 RepID=A0A1Y2MNZ5_PSEAH|nr:MULTISPECIES: SDR family NAD(P)-dependent oxidoreductase [Pseudonocardia]OSY36965.1 3-oxoacyl-[acyl-carrier-protein] reductase FabG [Pseudonocardia autotrophica]TDN75648.1 3-oxoacyl-[acyl-carrier protein] reductase [Pseudonocardia autotrophica]BBF99620.1 3-oxoacyl-ACP reductase [Pseudonocardia autotrophica]GEC27682.1 3-oxoacyl-ACP reductase [Pseudonocardia saturnea]
MTGTALVTGGAGGIGRAVCARLAADGFTVLLADLDRSAAQLAASTIGHGVEPWALDVTDPESRRAAVARADALGGADLLVNCAGVLRDARIRKLDPAVFRRLNEINLLGPLAMIRLAAEGMAERGRGSIVNVASRAWLGTFGSAAYSTAKGGLVGATRSLSLELGPRGITVNAVAPGFVDTPMTDSLPPEIRRRALAAIPVGRAGTPDDAASAVGYLAGAGYVTGQVLVACGGRSVGDPYSEDGH